MRYIVNLEQITPHNVTRRTSRIDMDIEEQYKWMRRGKKFKTKYFAALGELFKETKDGSKEESKPMPDRRPGTNKTSSLA